MKADIPHQHLLHPRCRQDHHHQDYEVIRVDDTELTYSASAPSANFAFLSASSAYSSRMRSTPYQAGGVSANTNQWHTSPQYVLVSSAIARRRLANSLRFFMPLGNFMPSDISSFAKWALYTVRTIKTCKKYYRSASITESISVPNISRTLWLS